jgi:hypothetical protein
LGLILGGAAVHRCGNRSILNKALAAEGRQSSNLRHYRLPILFDGCLSPLSRWDSGRIFYFLVQIQRSKDLSEIIKRSTEESR